MADDVQKEVAEMKALQGLAERTPARRKHRRRYPSGIYRVVESEELANLTQQGWRVVQVLVQMQRVLDRSDGITGNRAAPEPPYQRNTGGWLQDSGPNLFGPKPEDPAVSTLWRTSHVEITRFLVRQDEASALAVLAASLERAERANLEHRHAASDAQRKLTEAERTIADLEKRRDAQAERLISEQRTSEERLRQERKMEVEMGKIRGANEKLMRAVGEIRAKEILAKKD